MQDNPKNSKTKLTELGEFKLIDHLTTNFNITQASTKLSIGDDAAVVRHQDNTLISTDLLVEGVHFDLAYMPLKHLGYKAVIVNLSDIYAMNAEATQITVSIACSNRFTVEALEEIYAGIQKACEIYNVDLVGGDTTSSVKGLQISVTAIGVAEEENIVKRSGAKPNELLVVSGDLGAAYMGLQVLKRENEVFKVNPNNQPDLSPYAYIIERQLKPEARKDIPELLEKLEVKPTSMIDISDGLSSEILHLCNSSKVGVKLFEEKIPLDPMVISSCEEFELDSTTIALSGGEDYELLFTIKQDDFPKIKANPNLSVIGHMTSEDVGKHIITRAEQQIPLVARGWSSIPEQE
ncbi:thiamine-phosphate kinase [Mesohalobacter halotolerans]|uniref:Thiamine-monophosphate kinase n=1 Tax=Mesohalobacter halotolerans TaxID=1883405 RepID=A0A4U5TQH9_9FLAO|nr:thiamine-phosphate kinase [Mesohalobacter halotolerans]TKS56303.1 thiamine-phosphate kinase [Mesohalobacter halotolerans]